MRRAFQTVRARLKQRLSVPPPILREVLTVARQICRGKRILQTIFPRFWPNPAGSNQISIWTSPRNSRVPCNYGNKADVWSAWRLDTEGIDPVPNAGWEPASALRGLGVRPLPSACHWCRRNARLWSESGNLKIE